MPSLGSLYYTLGIKDLTDADLQKINGKLKNLGFDIQLTPKILKDLTQSAVPKGIKIELDPTIKNDALARAVEGKVMRIAVTPLLTGFREAIVRATRENPPQAEVGVSEARLRTLIQNVLNRQGFVLNISTVNDNYSRVIQAKLNGTAYKVKIHADAREITQSVQASLMQVQSRAFGLKVSRDVLYRSIDDALGQKRFNINIAVSHGQARRAVQDALLRAQVIGKDQALAYQRLQTGEMKAAQAELMRLKAAHMGAADAAKAHASASINLGGAMGSNIKIAGELGSAMASMYSIHAAKEFLSQVIEIGGELEHQKIAMDTIFGDKGKTNTLFGQVKGLARQSPFGVMELTKSIKALSAYGVEYNEIYDTAKRLADISAATSVDINRLILAFGKTKSRGFLDGLEAKQFAYANIPIYEMVRKKLEELEGQAVTTADVMARMKKREIGFDIVKDVLWDITDPGGKFYDMQEALAGSVKTSWKLVRDNIELMFGEIAESAAGDSLKSLAEILQGLTREWRTVADVVGTAAVGLGMYKIAVIASNAVMSKAVAASIRKVSASRAEQEANLKAALSYRRLTQEEINNTVAARAAHKITGLRIFSRQQLTFKEIEALMTTKSITKNDILRLVAMKRVDAETASRLLLTDRMTQAERNLLYVEIERAQLAKRSTVIWRSLGVAMSGFGAALKAFLLNPWTVTMAAISGLVALYQHMSEQSNMAKELGENLSTKAAEGARNLTDALKGLNGEFSKMSEIQLTGTIEKLEQAIKDYGIFAEKTLFYSRTDENGVERSLEERAEYLYQQAKILENAYAKFRDWKVGDMVARASDSTNGSFWTLQWYEGLQTDLNDYVEGVKDAQKELTKYLRDNKDEARLVIKFAADIDPEFAELTKDMGIEQAMTALTSNLEKLQNVYANIPRVGGRLELEGTDLYRFADLSDQFLNNWTNTDVAHRMNEALKEAEKAMASFRKDLLAKDKTFFDVDKWTEEKSLMMGMAFQEIFKKLEGLDYQFQMPFVDVWNKYFNTSFDPQFIEGQIQTQFSSLIPELGEELAKKVRNGEQLEDAEEDKVKSLFNKAVETVKNSWPGKAAEIQKIVDSKRVYANSLLAVNNRAGMDKWKQQIDDAFGNNPDITVKIKGEADTQSTLKALAEMKKETKAALDKFGLSFNITPNFGNLEKLSTDGPLTPFEKQQREEYNKFVDLWNNITKGEKELGINLDQWSKSKDKGSKKDTLAESLKQRFKDIKDAWSEFQKWSKTEGKQAAATRIGESGLFSTLSKDKIPQTVEQYRALVVELENELRKAGVKGTARESLLNDLLKQKLDIDNTIVSEQLKLALDKVSKEAERQLADWNLFDKIRKATGNQDLAMSIAFGMNVKGETDYPTMIKQQLQKTVDAAETALSKVKPKKGESPYQIQGYNYDKLKKLYDARDTDEGMQKWTAVPEEIRKAWEKANGDILKYFDQQKDAIADILNEYQSLQDKLAKIDADRQRKINTVNRSDMSAPDKAKYIQRINVEADYQKFTQSNEYLQFFNDIYGLTMDEANRIGDLIQLNLNQKLQAGLITIYDYEQQMEKVRKQLESLRNVKSDAMTFLTGGLKGLSQKRLQKAEGELANSEDYQKALADQIAAQEALNKAKKEGNEEEIAAAEAQLALANQSVKTFTALRDKIIADQEKMQNVADVAAIAANIAGGISDAFGAVKDIAASFGVDTDSGAWLDVGAVVDTLTSVTSGVSQVLGSLLKGDIGGAIGGVFKTIATPFTIWSDLHDKKMQRLIERSKEAAKIMQNQYDILEKRMANFLGNAANMGTGTQGGAYGKQRQLMQSQLRELQKQRQAELGKKKTDKSVVEDYNKQIEEMKISIRDFALEAAKDLYGIDLNGWAQQLGDSLVDAFAKGEDAAEAFDKTVGDIMRDVTKKMISQDILAPMFGDLRNYLFGENGMSGAFGADFKLDSSEIAAMKEYLDKIKNQGIPAAEELFNAINSATGGLLDDTDKAKSGLSAGIQALTEDTGSLVASYLNGVRGDVSVQTHDYWPRLLESMPQISVLAQSQLDTQKQIAENTLRNAVAAEEIVKSNDAMSRLLIRVTQGGAKFYVQ